MSTIKAEELRVGDRFKYRETPYTTVWEVKSTFPGSRELGYADACTGYQIVQSFDYLDGTGGLELVSRAAPAVETITQPAVTGVKHDDNKPWAGTVLAGFWYPRLDNELAAALEDKLTDDDNDDDAGPYARAIKKLLSVDLPLMQRFYSARDVLLNDDCNALSRATRVGTYGARKYARDNWLHVDDGINRYYEAAGRHVLQILCGNWIDKPDDVNDPGSGLANLDHICWCIFAGAKLADKAAT